MYNSIIRGNIQWHVNKWHVYVEVSYNNSTPKSSIVNKPSSYFWGIPMIMKLKKMTRIPMISRRKKSRRNCRSIVLATILALALRASLSATGTTMSRFFHSPAMPFLGARISMTGELSLIRLYIHVDIWHTFWILHIYIYTYLFIY